MVYGGLTREGHPCLNSTRHDSFLRSSQRCCGL